MKIYIIRHAQSKNNVLKCDNYTPSISYELTKIGKEQAKKVAEEFKNIKFDAIFSSGITRALRTAEAINTFQNLEIKIDNRIVEVNTGFEGMDYSYYNNFLKDSNDPINSKPKFNAESVKEVIERISDFLEEVKKMKFENVLIVTHGMPASLMKGYLLNLNMTDNYQTSRRKEFYNCTYKILEI